MSIYMGIDWSQDKHDVAFMNAAGAIIARLTITHQPDGFHKLETTRQQLAVPAAECLVGLETAHNLLLDHLWDNGYQEIYVIPPLVVKSSRGRYGHSGARDCVTSETVVCDVISYRTCQDPIFLNSSFWLGGDDLTSIKNAGIVKKGSEAILDNNKFLIILRNQHPIIKS